MTRMFVNEVRVQKILRGICTVNGVSLMELELYDRTRRGKYNFSCILIGGSEFSSSTKPEDLCSMEKKKGKVLRHQPQSVNLQFLPKFMNINKQSIWSRQFPEYPLLHLVLAEKIQEKLNIPGGGIRTT